VIKSSQFHKLLLYYCYKARVRNHVYNKGWKDIQWNSMQNADAKFQFVSVERVELRQNSFKEWEENVRMLQLVRHLLVVPDMRVAIRQNNSKVNVFWLASHRYSFCWVPRTAIIGMCDHLSTGPCLDYRHL